MSGQRSEEVNYVLGDWQPEPVDLRKLTPGQRRDIVREALDQCLALPGLLVFEPVQRCWEFSNLLNGRQQYRIFPESGAELDLPVTWDAAWEVSRLTTLEEHAKPHEHAGTTFMMRQEYVLMVTRDGTLCLLDDHFRRVVTGEDRRDTTTRVAIGILTQDQIESWLTPERTHALITFLRDRARCFAQEISTRATMAVQIREWLDGVDVRHTLSSVDGVDDDIPF